VKIIWLSSFRKWVVVVVIVARSQVKLTNYYVLYHSFPRKKREEKKGINGNIHVTYMRIQYIGGSVIYRSADILFNKIFNQLTARESHN
jgi:hypothetical protein